MSNLEQIRNWQAQLQQARSRLTAEQAGLQQVPRLQEESLITDASTVNITVANNIREPGLRARCISLAQTVVAREEYQRGEVVGPPTDRTTGSSHTHRADDPHITVRLPDQTIHIYVKHQGGKRFVCRRRDRMRDPHYIARGYSYEDVTFGPRGFRFSRTKITPRQRRVERTQRDIREAERHNAPIANRIGILEERIRALENMIHAAQHPHGSDGGGRGGHHHPDGRDDHGRGGSHTMGSHTMSTSMAHHTGSSQGGHHPGRDDHGRGGSHTMGSHTMSTSMAHHTGSSQGGHHPGGDDHGRGGSHTMSSHTMSTSMAHHTGSAQGGGNGGGRGVRHHRGH